ncbi:hypothetical protein JXO59_09190 [candidate division KSB1 bacterium]|nr:hypothetical protein [candidate division KSB1 bacterium]
MNQTEINIRDRKLYIPRMSYEGARCMAAAFQSIGIDACVAPEDDAHSYELARRYLSGDECLPEAVTLGGFLKVTEQPDYDPSRTAFLLATSNGPCRFGHYLPLAKKIFQQRGEDVLIFAPTSANGYKDIGKNAQELIRTAWRAVIVSDILRKLLLKTRPYEKQPGLTDRIFQTSLDRVCQALALQGISHEQRMQELIIAMTAMRDAFRTIKVDKSQRKPLIGIVGEIFCRLNDFSNSYLLRLIEKCGGETWMSDVAEWVWYTSDEEERNLIRKNKRFSLSMVSCKVRQRIMHHDEQRILSLFREDFKGYAEPHHITEVLDLSRPYLPREGAHGEMVISVGKAIWFQKQGAAGVVDISPFTCMNGIVCETVYPRVSKDLGGFPIRVFYFDGLQTDFESDVEIFMELALNYQKNKMQQ